MADTTTKTLRLTIAASTSTAEQAFANLNKEIKNTGVSITGFTTAMTKNAAGMDSYAHYVTLASTSLKELEKTQKSIVGSSAKTPITSNILKDERDIYKERADLAAKSSATMVEKAKAAVTAQLIAIREGENSIAAVKNSSAERQKQIETNLQEKLKSIRDRYAAGEFNKGSLDLSIRSITEAYQRQTVSLVTETDKRIAKIKEEIAAQQEAARVARLSIAQRLGEAQIYTPRSDAGIALARGMTQAGIAARPAEQVPPPPPRVPEDVKNGYDSLFARIGAINIEYRLWNTAINAVNNSLSAIPKIGIELDATKASLLATMGSEAGMSSALKALNVEADRTGISLKALRENFRLFQASTSLSGVALDSTWKMFQNMNTVSTALHLTTDQTTHVFLALSQMFNKTKVQSEELVKQLGNLLPGAFASFQKANRDTYPTVLALTEAMKKGTVLAQETMEKFTQFMADKFSVSFQVAALGVNANIGRMQNSFTALGETIYGMSSGALLSAVKGITNLTNYINESIKGNTSLGESFTTLGRVIEFVLITTLANSVKNLIASTAALQSLEAAVAAAKIGVEGLKLALMSLGAPAVIAAIGLAITEIFRLKSARQSLYDQADEFRKNRDAEKAKLDLGLPLDVAVGKSEEVNTAKENLKKYQEELAKTKSDLDQFKNATTLSKKGLQAIELGEFVTEDKLKARLDDAQKNIILWENNLKDVTVAKTIEIEKARQDAAKNAVYGGKDYSQERLRMEIEAARASKDYIKQAELQFQSQHGATIDALTKANEKLKTSIKADETELAKTGDEIVKERLQHNREELESNSKFLAQSEITKAADLKAAQERVDKERESVAKKGVAERLKTAKEEINVVKQYQATATNEAENQLKLLKGENDAKIYSFEEFVRRKKALLTEDFQNQETFYNQEIALATKTGKKDLIAQYTEKLKQAKTTYETQVGTAETKGIIDNEAKQNIDAYNTNLAMIHEKYQDILGIERDSNAITSAKLELIRQQLVLESTEKGEVGETARQRLIELEVLKEAQNLKSKMAIYDKETATAEKIHGDAVSRINQLEQVGQISSLSATMARTKANERLLEIRQKDVDLAKKALDEAKPEARPASQASYDLAVQKLESLKLVANETGAMIEQSLGDAFESSFKGLITNTMTAKEAFKSFATSIVEGIARIVAQEVKSAILKPILKMGLSSLGGLFSSAVPTTEAAPTLLTAANGGVFSGAGISAHSGTVVSTPTIFPFAKGGGLMGEAGPEAILPLKRNSQGKLGVSVDNTGQPRGGNIYYINTTVNAKSDASPADIANKTSEAIIRAIAKQEINSAARPGNRLNQITKYG
jgi:tape measure domain-containing protein